MKFLIREFGRSTLELIPCFWLISFLISYGVTNVELLANMLQLQPEMLSQLWQTIFFGIVIVYVVEAIAEIGVLHRRFIKTSQRLGLSYRKISFVRQRLKLYKEKPMSKWTTNWVEQRYQKELRARKELKKNQLAYKHRFDGSSEFMINKGASK